MSRSVGRSPAAALRSVTLTGALVLSAGAAAPALSQTTRSREAAEPDVASLVEQARAARDGVTFASAVGGMVKVAHQRPAQGPAVVAALTEFVRGADTLRRAMAVDAVQNLPPRSREAMVPVLSELARARGEGPAARLFVRGLAEAGAPGRAALRALVAESALRGDALDLARMYLGG